MYTRSYYPEQETLKVPENYDGLALGDENANDKQKEEIPKESAPLRAPWDTPTEEKSETEAVSAAANTYTGALGGLISKIPFLHGLDRFDFLKKEISSIGTEELLIIGLALFLLFSKSGDKECSLMLLFLLFVR